MKHISAHISVNMELCSIQIPSVLYPHKSEEYLVLNTYQFSYCWGTSYLAWFMLSYASIGSFGMALYRVLYLKSSNWVSIFDCFGFGHFDGLQKYLLFRQDNLFL